MRQRQRTKLTLEEHRRMGKRLSTMQARLGEDMERLFASYPKSSTVVRSAKQALSALRSLRWKLDSAVHAENPQHADLNEVYNCGADPKPDSES